MDSELGGLLAPEPSPETLSIFPLQQYPTANLLQPRTVNRLLTLYLFIWDGLITHKLSLISLSTYPEMNRTPAEGNHMVFSERSWKKTYFTIQAQIDGQHRQGNPTNASSPFSRLSCRS